MKTVLVTGANRGIGLALCHAYARDGWSVIAVCRHSNPTLEAIPNTQIEAGIDVTCSQSLATLQAHLADRAIDVLINNAGLLAKTQLANIELELQSYRDQFEVNTLAPLRVTNALLACLVSGSKVIIITSRMGSIADNTSGGHYAYRISKSGVNSAGRSLALELAPKGIAVGLLHPGYVKTDMTGQTGQIDSAMAAEQLKARIEALDLIGTGSFWHVNGDTLPW
jgi:NAD(P)-dependent dehydrogenase (short-subunit alcohol dehydrogenase family)